MSARSTLPPGESTKSFRELEPLCERLLELGLERGDLVVALGGGVIGDLAGFAAAILRRGVRFVQIPTSLLAQVDSSVGGKTGIDTPQGKNLIGAFHQPGLVLADTDTLRTLSGRELRAGYAEVAKYGLLGDAAFFAWLEKNHKRRVRAGSRAADACRRDERQSQSRHRRPRRDRAGRARAAQPRPHLRTRVRSLVRLFRPPAARRGDRHRHGHRFPLLGGARLLRCCGGRSRRRPLRAPSGCRRASARSPATSPASKP